MCAVGSGVFDVSLEEMRACALGFDDYCSALGAVFC